jgi:hypothetical protein
MDEASCNALAAAIRDHADAVRDVAAAIRERTEAEFGDEPKGETLMDDEK